MKRTVNVLIAAAAIIAIGLLFYSVSHHEAFSYAATMLLITGALTIIPTK